MQNQDKSHFFRHICHYYSKFLSVQVKNHSELIEKTANFSYSIGDNYDFGQKLTTEEMMEWMEKTLK